jgi:colanic acid biosynthesis glycosyl transferase WcaI
MRILIHDYSGHAFTVQLARWLAEQGLETHYWYSTAFESPHGNLQVTPDDAATLRIRGIGGEGKLNKYSPLARVKQEKIYGRDVANLAARLSADVILSNAPPQIQAQLRGAAQHGGGVFLFWMQDIYSLALRHLLQKKSAAAAALLGPFFTRYEEGQMRKADAVVCISQAFRDYCRNAGVPDDRSFVIENWAALADIPVLPKDNEWSRAHGLDGKFVFLFSGTLGLKHDPEVFVALARSLRDDPRAACVVISQGAGRQHLERRKTELGLANLHLLDFQPHGDFPQVLATGDVLMAILEPFASELSVPSKVLAYVCAGRPLLAAIPQANHSARLVRDSGAGVVVAPGETQAFLDAAHALMRDAGARQAHAAAARAFAERSFEIDRIGARFLAAFEAARRPR